MVLKDSLVDILGKDSIVVKVTAGSFPDCIDALLVVELFEDTVTA